MIGINDLIQDVSSFIRNLAGPAAILNELDLLISANTAIVHLAGAMNKPAWFLLPIALNGVGYLTRKIHPGIPVFACFDKQKDQAGRSL